MVTSSGPLVDSHALRADWERLPPAYRVPEIPPSPEEAREYCRRLARTHYENFSVATWFLPRSLRQHFYNVYAYCRISDDLGDEVGDPGASLRLLDQWEAELDACYSGQARHPVFVALSETIRRFSIPRYEFADLLSAFRRDQSVRCYQTFEELVDYCRYSANPVGHLVLYVCGYRDEERQRLADRTCTALQLANHWQDVARDYASGRIYLPAEDMRRFGVSEQDLGRSKATPAFVEMMRLQVERARQWFLEGAPLAAKVNRELAMDILLFSRGGMAVLEAIEQQGYDVLVRRPVISRWKKLRLILRAAGERLR